MPEQVPKPNYKLKAARERKIWTIPEAAEKVGVDSQTYWRWENYVHQPHAYSLRKLCEVFGMSREDLGFGRSSKSVDQAQQIEESVTEEKRRDEATKPTIGASNHQGPSFIRLTPEQVAVLLSLLKVSAMAHFDPKKRKTLRQLIIAVSLAMGEPQKFIDAKSWGQMPLLTSEIAIDEETLDRFDKLISLCWRLLKGNDLMTVEYLLSMFLPEVEALAQQPSKYQKIVAGFTAQAHILKSLVVGHQDDLQSKLAECSYAIEYSRLAENPNLEVTALIQQAVALDYKKQHDKSLQIYQQAFSSVQNVSPLLGTRILAGLAGSYARCGQQEQEARRYLELARETMPVRPENDPSFLYADCGRFTLSLWEGRIYFELDQIDQAFEVFSQVENQTDTPERIRTEFLNHMLETSIAQGDLDKSIFCLKRAGKAAVDLKSDRRQREVHEACQMMLTMWRQDRKRIRDAAAEVFST
jgi:transcriptional regulator with XRE-family HTH domain